MRMLIRMNNDKIIEEKKYNLESIFMALKNLFIRIGLQGTFDDIDTLIYQSNGDDKDYGRFGKIVNFLKKQEWFMENVLDWKLYENIDLEGSEELTEEDLVSHYRHKQLVKG